MKWPFSRINGEPLWCVALDWVSAIILFGFLVGLVCLIAHYLGVD